MKSRIPIFPLKLVLFPGAKYPLHIFEERYKKMINRCIERDEEFGIVSNIDSNFSKVGCIAIVEKVTRTYSDGSFDIVVTGKDRFKTKSIVLGNEGYLEAEIIPFADYEITEIDELLYNKTVDKLLEILKIADVKLGNEFWANLTVADIKSFKLAEKAGLNLKQQQNVLSSQDEISRLNYIYDHLNKVEGIIEKNKIAQELIAGDGYLNQ